MDMLVVCSKTIILSVEWFAYWPLETAAQDPITKVVQMNAKWVSGFAIQSIVVTNKRKKKIITETEEIFSDWIAHNVSIEIIFQLHFRIINDCWWRSLNVWKHINND